jgi:hypothetical protein
MKKMTEKEFIKEIKEKLEKCVDLGIKITFINLKKSDAEYTFLGDNKINLLWDYEQILSQLDKLISNHMNNMIDEEKLNLVDYYNHLLTLE